MGSHLRARVPRVEESGVVSTPDASSRETLSAVAHGGNPQDRAASPRHWLPMSDWLSRWVISY
ncbi:MAG: hypothetical protein KME31_07100 [Tolypothrix carrinoi HA7290-LM1]|nr:hypothetical protein [Tolypothrix carrinoi HA7290-LM1]